MSKTTDDFVENFQMGVGCGGFIFIMIIVGSCVFGTFKTYIKVLKGDKTEIKK